MGKAISYNSHVTLLRGAGWAKATQEPYMGWNRNTGTVEGEQGRCPVLSPLDFSRNLISLLSLRFHNQGRRLGCPSSKSPITGENLLEARVVPLVRTVLGDLRLCGLAAMDIAQSINPRHMALDLTSRSANTSRSNGAHR